MGATSSQTGKGTRKYGRNKDKCARYRAEHRGEKNKARRKAQLEKKYAKNRAKREAQAGGNKKIGTNTG